MMIRCSTTDGHYFIIQARHVVTVRVTIQYEWAKSIIETTNGTEYYSSETVNEIELKLARTFEAQ